MATTRRPAVAGRSLLAPCAFAALAACSGPKDLEPAPRSSDDPTAPFAADAETVRATRSAGAPQIQAAVDVMASADDDPRRALDYVEAAFEQGFDEPSYVLTAPALQPLRDDPEFRGTLRELIREHPAEARVRIVDPQDEPGTPLTVTLQIVDSDGSPLADAVVHVFHADHRGFYTPQADAPGEGNDDPRLFATARADADGRVVFETILPGSYGPATPHFHCDIEGRIDGETVQRDGTLYFESPTDDWLIDTGTRARAERGAAWIAPAVERRDGGLTAEQRIRLTD